MSAYLCPDCLVWHITSQKHPDYEIESLRKAIHQKNLLINQLGQRIGELKKKLKDARI